MERNSGTGRRPLVSRGRGLLLLAALTLALLFILVTPALAQVKSWGIDQMNVLLDVQRNGVVQVEETVTFTFQGSFSYVTRAIPTGNLESLGDIEVLQDGKALPQGEGPGTWETFTSGGDRIIQINFQLTDASATWTLRYRALGAIQHFDEGDQLVWYVFDAKTPVPIGGVNTTVRLPGEVPVDKMTAAVDTGPSVESNQTASAPGTVQFTAGEVPAYTNFWIRVGFPKGVVTYQWTLRRVLAAVVPRAAFLLPVAAFLGMLLLWSKRGRDAPSAVFAKYVSEPPSALPPGLAGALIDEEANVTEVTATIVDLAHRGYLDMTEDKERGLFAKSLVTFRKLKPTNDLEGFEKKVADALFGQQDSVTTKQLKNSFYAHIAPISDSIYEEVTKRGFFHANPKTVRQKWLGIGVVTAIGLGILTVVLAIFGIAGWGFWLIGSTIAVVIVLAFSGRMPQRTAKGAEETRKWEAFRNYLRDLTRYQDMETAKDTFEKYLPYAIAFKVEKDWVRRFQDMNVPAPTWYHPVFLPMYGGWVAGEPGQNMSPIGGQGSGPAVPSGAPGGGFSLDTISDSLFGSLSSVSNVLTSAPSSTGSSRGAFGGGGGGFGGGFSGGGGGGGFGAG